MHIHKYTRELGYQSHCGRLTRYLLEISVFIGRRTYAPCTYFGAKIFLQIYYLSSSSSACTPRCTCVKLTR